MNICKMILVVIAVFVSFSTNLMVAEAEAMEPKWILAAATKSSDTVMYYDLNSLRRSGNQVVVWVLTDYISPLMFGHKSILSSKDLWIVNCFERTKTERESISFSEFHGEGEIISKGGTNKTVGVIPGSIVDVLLDNICL